MTALPVYMDTQAVFNLRHLSAVKWLSCDLPSILRRHNIALPWLNNKQNTIGFCALCGAGSLGAVLMVSWQGGAVSQSWHVTILWQTDGPGPARRGLAAIQSRSRLHVRTLETTWILRHLLVRSVNSSALMRCRAQNNDLPLWLTGFASSLLCVPRYRY